MIPSGHKKPGYPERLKFAFGQRKKIEGLRNKLKEFQRKIMFMMTSYQLHFFQQIIPKEPPGAGMAAHYAGVPLPSGSLHGIMTHIPVQFSVGDQGRGVPSVKYEATISLKPAEGQPIPASNITSGPSGGPAFANRTRISLDEAQLRMLENMQRGSALSSVASAPLPSRRRTEAEARMRARMSASERAERENTRIKVLEKAALSLRVELEKLETSDAPRSEREEKRATLLRELYRIEEEMRIEKELKQQLRLREERIQRLQAAEFDGRDYQYQVSRFDDDRLFLEKGSEISKPHITSREQAHQEVKKLLRRV